MCKVIFMYALERKRTNTKKEKEKNENNKMTNRSGCRSCQEVDKPGSKRARGDVVNEGDP